MKDFIKSRNKEGEKGKVIRFSLLQHVESMQYTCVNELKHFCLFRSRKFGDGV